MLCIDTESEERGQGVPLQWGGGWGGAEKLPQPLLEAVRRGVWSGFLWWGPHRSLSPYRAVEKDL